MNNAELSKANLYEHNSLILLGLEKLYPHEEMIPRVRFVIEGLSQVDQDREKITTDFFTLLKVLGDFPLTPHMQALVSAKTGFESWQAVLRLLDHLSYDCSFSNTLLLSAHLQETESANPAISNILIKWLGEKCHEKGFEFCADFKSIMLEESAFIRIKKILSFYIEIYQDSKLILLRKAYEHYVSLSSMGQFYAFLYKSTGFKIFDQIKVITYEEGAEVISDAFTKGQVESKLWAYQELSSVLKINPIENVLLLCGWIGLLARLFFDNLKLNIISVDLDEACQGRSWKINFLEAIDGRFNSLTQNIMDLNYDRLGLPLSPNRPDEILNAADLIVNTSCEHILDFKMWYRKLPNGQLLLLQSNNFVGIEEHVNCVASLEEFQLQAPMTETYFAGELQLEKYTRFMLIGRK